MQSVITADLPGPDRPTRSSQQLFGRIARVRPAPAAADTEVATKATKPTEDLPARDALTAVASHAQAANGFADAGVAMVEVAMAQAATPQAALAPASYSLHQQARRLRAGAIGAALASLAARVRRACQTHQQAKLERATWASLRGLDDRTLHDIGIHRSELRSVARELARGPGLDFTTRRPRS